MKKQTRKIFGGILLAVGLSLTHFSYLSAEPLPPPAGNLSSASTFTTTAAAGSLEILSGNSRFATAVTISQATYAYANTAIIVQSSNFPDALAAGPLAYANAAPILLTPADQLNADTLAELKRLGVRNVILVGGLSAISEKVVTELQSAGFSTTRLSGPTRYDTAAMAGQALISKSGNQNKAVLTAGDQFADAIAAGSFAARNGYPILLTAASSLPAATAEMLKANSIQEVIIAGGTMVVDQSVENAIKAMGIAVTRISGSTRTDTAVKMAKTYFQNSRSAFITNGWNYVDALAATPLAAKKNAPMILVQAEYIAQSTQDYLRDYGIGSAYVIGGEMAVSPLVYPVLNQAIAPEIIPIQVRQSDGSLMTTNITARFNKFHSLKAFDLQNAHRVKNGQSPLIWDNAYYEAAKIRVAELAVSFSHTRPDGRSCYTVDPLQAFRGENAACGYFTPEQMITALMNSAGHNENMLKSTHKLGAISGAIIDNQYYWIALFGVPN